MGKESLRVIDWKEMKKVSRSSLVGKCAMRIYLDGNITFSKKAADLLNFAEFNYFNIGMDNEDQLHIIPNNNESGFGIHNRIGKFTWLANSKMLRSYLDEVCGLSLSKRSEPLEFKILKPVKQIEGFHAFVLKAKYTMKKSNL